MPTFILEIQLPIVAFFQEHHELLIVLYRAMSFCADELGFILFLPFLLWCVDYKKSIEIAFVLLVCIGLNTFLKESIGQLRPADIDTSLTLLTHTTGLSLPSGHSQAAIVFWGLIAYLFNNIRFWLIAIIISLCVGISRVALAAHFPTDVFAGWFVGILFLGTYIIFRVPILNAIQAIPIRSHVILAILIPVSLLIVMPTFDNALGQGALSGLWLGAILSVKIETRHVILRSLSYYIIGMGIMLLWYCAFKLTSIPHDTHLYLIIQFLKYWMLAFFASHLAFYVFAVTGSFNRGKIKESA